MAKADRPPADLGSIWSTTDEDSSSEEEWSTAPASPSESPASPVKQASTHNNGDSARCSSLCHDHSRQDRQIACAHIGEHYQHNIDTRSLQPTATSDLTSTFSTHLNHKPPVPKPKLQDLQKAFDFVITIEDNMGRFSKRDRRQRHQTREFFDYEPRSDQDSSEGNPNTTTAAPATTNRHRAVVKGVIKDCPGAENCVDCKAGRSAPVRDDDLASLPDITSGSSIASVSKRLNETVQTTAFKIFELHYGLRHTEQGTMEAATKSKAPVRSESEKPINAWEVFDILTDRLRQNAAERTILYLVREMDLDKVAKGFIAGGVPFLKETQLVDMLTTAQTRPEWYSGSVEPSLPDEVQASSSSTRLTPATHDQHLSSTKETMTVVHSKESQGMKDTRTREELKCAGRGKIWADLLIQENRRLRAAWILQMSEAFDAADDEAVPPEELSEDTKVMYELLKAEDEAKLAAQRKALTVDSDLVTTMNRAGQSGLPSNLNISHSERFSELLSVPKFLPLAKHSLKVWCMKNSVAPNSRRTRGMYLSLLKNGNDLPKHAWDSTPPPIWDATGMRWMWQDSSKTDKGKDTSTPSSGNKHKTKDTSTPHTDIEDQAEASEDVSTSQAVSNEGLEEKAATLTKNQKRAKARKERRKAMREAVAVTDDTNTASEARVRTEEEFQQALEASIITQIPVRTNEEFHEAIQAAAPEIPVQAEEDFQDITRSITPEIPLRTQEEIQQAVQIASAGIQEALASRPGPSTSTQTVTRDGTTYRVPAPARVSLDVAINLAGCGRLRVSLCPPLEKGDANRLLKASRRFQNAIDFKNRLGKDPHAVTKFLIKVGMKPSEYEEVLELDKFLEVMKKLEGLDHTPPTTTSTTTGAAYPPPPPKPFAPLSVPTWASSIPPSSLPSLSPRDRTLHLRGLLFLARSFLASAARLLPATIFDRLLHPATLVLAAADLPVARYQLARTVAFARVMDEVYRRHRHRQAGEVVVVVAGGQDGVPDPVAIAIADLNAKFDTVEALVEWARARWSGDAGFAECLAAGGVEGEVGPEMGGVELAALGQRAVLVAAGGGSGSAAGVEMERVVDRAAEGVVEFLRKWPTLEGVVVGGERRYVKPAA